MHKYLKIVIPVLLAGGCLAALLAGLGGTARAKPLAWTAAQQMPEAFGGPGFVQCPDDPDSFYIVGGSGSGIFQWRNQFYKYDAADDSWWTLANLPQSLFGVAATCYEDKIYVAGGWLGVAVDDLYIYDIPTDTWASGPDLPRVVSGAVLGAWDGKLYLVGGGPFSMPVPPVPDVDIYDIGSGNWSATAGVDMPVPASYPGWVQRGKYLFIVGGSSGDYDNNLDVTQRYDMSIDDWEMGPTFSSQRAAFALSMTGNYLYAIGGDVNSSEVNLQTDLVESLDLSLWPGGSWMDISDPIPQELFTNVGFCTQAMSGGEVWSVAGFYGVFPNYTSVDTNLYRPAEACYDFYFGDLAPESLAGEGYRGATVSYDLTLHNDGTLTDTFDIVVSSVWATTAPPEVGPLAPGESSTLSVTVEVPYGAAPGDMDTAQVVAASQGDPGMQDSALITTTAITDWVSAASMPQPLATDLVQCPDDPDGFYSIGGISNVSVVDKLYHFDAAANEWNITLEDLPEPRYRVAVACYQGKIYVAGGSYANEIRNTLYIYDIASDTWSVGPSLPDIVFGATLGVWDGKLYLVGGTRIKNPWTPVGRVDVYDITSGAWTAGGGTSMPTAASFYGAAQRGPYLFVVGGLSGDFDNNVNQSQRYDMSSDSWEVGPTFGSQRALLGISMNGANLFTLGGDVNGSGGWEQTDLVEYLELSSWPGGGWTNLGDPLPVANLNPEGACTEAVSGGEVWSVGGGYFENQNYVYTDTNLFRPAGEGCLSYYFSPVLAPETQSGEARPGMTQSYTLTLTNAGDTPDAFDLSASSSWTVTLSGLTGALDAGESVTLTVDVHIPQDAIPYETDTTVITVTSQGDSSISTSAVLTTTALPEFGLALGSETNELSGYPGEMVAYSLTLSNTGTYTDTYELAPSGNAWEVHLPVTTTTLGVGEMVEVIVHVTVPVDAPATDSDMVTITASSGGDPGVQDTLVLTTTAIWRSNYLPLVRNP